MPSATTAMRALPSGMKKAMPVMRRNTAIKGKVRRRRKRLQGRGREGSAHGRRRRRAAARELGRRRTGRTCRWSRRREQPAGEEEGEEGGTEEGQQLDLFKSVRPRHRPRATQETHHDKVERAKAESGTESRDLVEAGLCETWRDRGQRPPVGERGARARRGAREGDVRRKMVDE